MSPTPTQKKGNKKNKARRKMTTRRPVILVIPIRMRISLKKNQRSLFNDTRIDLRATELLMSYALYSQILQNNSFQIFSPIPWLLELENVIKMKLRFRSHVLWQLKYRVTHNKKIKINEWNEKGRLAWFRIKEIGC